MEYNKEQQEVLIQDFIDMLFVQRNLSSNTLYAYKNDLQNFSRWLERRHYGDINDRSIYEYFFYMQNEIELAPRSIRRKYVSIQQYCDYLRMVLNLNEIFFRFTARKFQLPHYETICTIFFNISRYSTSKVSCSSKVSLFNPIAVANCIMKSSSVSSYSPSA